MIIGIVKKDDKCIIFVSLGSISQDFFSGTFGFEFLSILIGKGCLALQIDKETNKCIKKEYTHITDIKKYNGSEINANFFVNEKNDHISAIIFTDANICDFYDKNNTFIF